MKMEEYVHRIRMSQERAKENLDKYTKDEETSLRFQ